MNSRRKFLHAAAVSLPFLAGCSAPWDGGSRTSEQPPADAPGGEPTNTAEEPARDLRSRFDTVYNVVDEGADPEGGARVDSLVEELAGDDTLLYFPAGRYKIGSVLIRGVENFGLVGDGATFDIDEKGKNIYLSLRQVADVHVEGFTVDNSGKNEAAAVDLKCTGGTNRLRNYRVEGFVDVRRRTFAMTLMVEGEDTELAIENVDLSEGARNAGAAFVFPQRDFYDPERAAGALAFHDCVMNGWGKEGLYASAHSGPLEVVGGEYANNAIAQVRIGGGNAPTDAIVRDVTVRVTNIPDYVPPKNRLLRGIWLKEGDGALVENCDIQVHNLGRVQTQGAIVVNGQFGRVTIRDCDVTTTVPRPGIVAESPEEEYDATWMPSLDHLPPEWTVTVENTTIRGDISDTEAVHVVGRNGCVFRNVTVDRGGSRTDGIRLTRIESCRVEGSTISTERFPLVVTVPASAENCLVHLDETELRGETPEASAPLASANSNTFCVSTDTIPESNSASHRLFGLARTATGDPNRTTAGGTSDTGQSDGDVHLLYGRLFEE